MSRPSSLLFSLARDESGAAAAEMAIVSPLLLILMFGSMELGKFFLDQHVLVKAVRDGARYAARQSFLDYSGCGVSGGVATNTYNLTRTGQIASGGDARLAYWPDDSGTVTVTVSCDTSGTYEGIYRGSADGAPVVTVAASVPYTPLLGSIGFSTVGLTLNARSQAAVAGV
jgi:Flp pilus assembly protein TadG